MFLGSDAVLLDGMELGSQPTGLRLPDLQPVAGPPAASGPPRAQPPHLANKPPPAPRRRPADHLPPAVLRLLHALGAHGTDAEPGGESPPPSVGQSPPPTARRPVPRCRARPHLAPGPGAGPLTSESQHDPQGAGTGRINRVKESVCVGNTRGSSCLAMPGALEEFARDD